MALPLQSGLNHAEVGFLADMELVTIVPRQGLESISLLSGATPTLKPPHRADIPLWLALLMKKQRRANIVPPPWLHPVSLGEIIHHETRENPNAFSPPPPPPVRADVSRPGTVAPGRRYHDSAGARLLAPFQLSCTAAAPAGFLPFHWLEVAEALLAHAADDMPGAGEVRSLLRDLAEVRSAKLRSSTGSALGGFGGGIVSLRGIGALELAESRSFVLGVVDGVRSIGASVEAARREEEEAGGGIGGEDQSDEDMSL